jgi:hypothetical protein
MKKLVAVAAVLFAVQVYGGGIVVCESMTACRRPPPYLQYDTPTLTFTTIEGGTINVSVNFWPSEDCAGDPDASVDLPDSPVIGAGYWILSMDDWATNPDGTVFSIQWTIDGCPATACINGTTGKSPEVCQL